MMNIQLHTFGLTRYTYIILSCLCHSNARPVAQIYCDNEFENAADQGAILNFNLLDCYGQVIGYYQVKHLWKITHSQRALTSRNFIQKRISQDSDFTMTFLWWTQSVYFSPVIKKPLLFFHQVDKMACLFNIHLRTGCFCNTGACQAYLGISNQEVKSNLQVSEIFSCMQ